MSDATAVATAESVMDELRRVLAATPHPDDEGVPRVREQLATRRRHIESAMHGVHSASQALANVEARCRPWLDSVAAMRRLRASVAPDIAQVLDGVGVGNFARGAFEQLARRHAGSIVIQHALPLPELERQEVEAVAALAAAEAAVAGAVEHGMAVLAR